MKDYCLKHVMDCYLFPEDGSRHLTQTHTVSCVTSHFLALIALIVSDEKHKTHSGVLRTQKFWSPLLGMQRSVKGPSYTFSRLEFCLLLSSFCQLKCFPVLFKLEMLIRS